MAVRVQEADFDVGLEMEKLRARCNGVGAIVSFVGVVRDTVADGRIRSLTLEHYPSMTHKALTAIVAEARTRWPVIGIEVIHRVGALDAADQIVLVLVASAHRHDAFCACEFVMDALKTRAPFWKCEDTAAGSRWVEAHPGDDAALARWIDAPASGSTGSGP